MAFKMFKHSMEEFNNLFTSNLTKLVIDGPSNIIGEINPDGSKSEYFSETIMLLQDFFTRGKLRLRGYENGIMKKSSTTLAIFTSRANRSSILNPISEIH